MAEGYAAIDLLNELERERQNRRSKILKIRMRRERNAFEDMPEAEFTSVFRFPKDMVIELIEDLRPSLHEPRTYNGISVDTKVLAALQFYASGSYQKRVGLDFCLNLSQPSVSRCIAEVTAAINAVLFPRHVKFPQTREEIGKTKQGFMEKTQFPGVIGCIDGTHVAIVPPTAQQHEHLYVNRKGWHSKNVMIVCDSDLQITAVNARHPGSTHDSFIWRMSALRQHLEQQYELGGISGWLLGDSGYPREPWMLTPIVDAPPNTRESRYTARHCSTRNCVERCIGVLKARFRCLRKERGLHYTPVVAGQIINACVTLHNIARKNNVPVPAEPVVNAQYDDDVPQDFHHVPGGRLIVRADQVRARVIRDYF